jgi:uncharacterized protein YecE (DUF72 family)
MFKDGYAPLLRSGRLGAILMQFPWSFRNTDDNRHCVVRLQQRFQNYPLVLEVRDASWNDIGMLDWLEGMDIGLCNIDLPLFHNRSSPARGDVFGRVRASPWTEL